ncbi:site-specific DNA-methyltransferase [Candidatus Pacearchaeota archaeon]|nr:site-specific DNA-methyltransferase [Candidatus Pacearchaeota archaeon]
MTTVKTSKESVNITEQKLKELKEILPHCFIEGKIDFEILKKTLSNSIEQEDEKYIFSWTGKNETFRNIKSTSNATLSPLKDESLNFDDTKNLFIESENLEALKILQKSYYEKIKMIYIDPPYNTGKDFVYPDDFREDLKPYMEATGESHEGIKLVAIPETSGRFHSTWISMMYSRLFLSRNLLREDGVLFVSINNNEIHNLIRILNEIFGDENYISCLVWNSKYTVSNDKKFVSDQHEYILAFAKNIDVCDFYLLPRTEDSNKSYINHDDDPRGPWKPTPLHAKSGNKNLIFTFKNGVKWSAPEGRFPRYSKETLTRLDKENRLWFGKNGTSTPNVKTFLSEVKSGLTPGTLWKWQDVGHTHEANEELAKILGKGVFDNPKPTRLIRRMIQLATQKDNEEIILDFFAGSGTTAHAVLAQNEEDQGNRHFICIQIPEMVKNGKYTTIAEICKERIRHVCKEFEKNNKKKSKKLDNGFKVFKLTRSNYKIWDKHTKQNGKELRKQLTLFKNPLIDEYKIEDVIYECIIKEGFDLNSKIEQIKEKKNIIYKISDDSNHFFITLDEQIPESLIEKIGLKKDTLFICLDSALDDSKKLSLSLQCFLKTI